MIHLPVGHPVRFGHRGEVGRVRVREEPVTLGQRREAAAVARDVAHGDIVEPPVSTRWIVGDRVLGVDVDGSGGGREGGGNGAEALGGEAGVVAVVVVVKWADGSPDRYLFVVEVEERQRRKKTTWLLFRSVSKPRHFLAFGEAERRRTI
ncbi:hypothetical protein GW17_00059283 [Ensete ventricosum]|nr:hypothetical protein GW17_00059283 [Ensete ventricosum]